MPTPQVQTLCEKCGRELASGSRFCGLCGAPTPAALSQEPLAAEPVQPGDVLEGKWRIDSPIGRGGMGTVYLATDLALDRKVAVKMLAAELVDDETFVARFEREARITATLDHPRVVLVYGVGRHLGRPFIVMKHLQGETLAQRLARSRASGERMSVGAVRFIAAQLCAGLAHIHEHGLVHRDLKPSNVFLGPDLAATIIDFGILRDLKSDLALTRSGSVMGTPHYLSPEQVLGKACDHRVDLYSLGVILYELLTGRVPFDGASATQIFQKHLHEPPPDACLANPELPPEAGTFLREVLAKDPARRPQTAQELSAGFAQAFALDESPDPVAPTTPDLVPLTPGRPTVAGRPLPRVSEEAAPPGPLPAPPGAPAASPDLPEDAPEPPPAMEAPAASPTRTLWLGVAAGAATALLVGAVVLAQVLAEQPGAAPPPALARPKPPRAKTPPRPTVVEPLGPDEEFEEVDEEEPAEAVEASAPSAAPPAPAAP